LATIMELHLESVVLVQCGAIAHQLLALRQLIVAQVP
jgi:hypothetical protein